MHSMPAQRRLLSYVCRAFPTSVAAQAYVAMRAATFATLFRI
jgi:hypothetical protein